MTVPALPPLVEEEMRSLAEGREGRDRKDGLIGPLAVKGITRKWRIHVSPHGGPKLGLFQLMVNLQDGRIRAGIKEAILREVNGFW